LVPEVVKDRKSGFVVATLEDAVNAARRSGSLDRLDRAKSVWGRRG
jgi:hypothetical protein